MVQTPRERGTGKEAQEKETTQKKKKKKDSKSAVIQDPV